MFDKVRIEVEKMEGGDQSPDMRNKLQGDLYLVKNTYEEEYQKINGI